MPLTVRLAGLNLDADLVQEVLELLRMLDRESLAERVGGSGDERRPWLDTIADKLRGPLALDSFTPETIAAAYARISRDPRPVTELRRSARIGVARARKSNENIIFGLGHASVAEHACFNFDILGLSRLAAEELQSHRLLSFTEKSQRYISLTTDYVIPPELRGTAWEGRLETLIPRLFSQYETLCAALISHYLKDNTETDKEARLEAEGVAKEDARYLLPLAASTQMGMTINARSLEYIAREFSDHPLAELRALGQGLRDAVSGLAPSLVKYTTRGSYPRTNREALKTSFSPAVKSYSPVLHAGPIAKLAAMTPEGEARVLEALAFSQGMKPGVMGTHTIWRSLFADMTVHDAAPREFELANLTFEATISASCFAQLKRHRMMTLLAQPYALEDGVILPPSVRAAGLESAFAETVTQVTNAASELMAERPLLGAYLLTNAHRRHVIIHINARELYHFARLRCDRHAQWEIRQLAEQIVSQARDVWPGMLALACGKDQFAERYAEYFSG